MCGIVLRFGIQDTGDCFAGSLHTSSRLVRERFSGFILKDEFKRVLFGFASF